MSRPTAPTETAQRPPPRPSHTVQAEVLLRERGMKVTTPRLLVIKALLDRHRPTTAKELELALRGSSLDRVTIYRSLMALAAAGIAQPVSTTDGSRRFEIHAGPGCYAEHPHVQCRDCGALECLESGFLPSPLVPTQLAGYRIDEARLYLFGSCPRCQREARPKRPG